MEKRDSCDVVKTLSSATSNDGSRRVSIRDRPRWCPYKLDPLGHQTDVEAADHACAANADILPARRMRPLLGHDAEACPLHVNSTNRTALLILRFPAYPYIREQRSA